MSSESTAEAVDASTIQNLERGDVANRSSKLIAITIVLAALVFAFLTRVISIFQYIDFYGDEARFAEHVMDIWRGIWPAFGPHPYNQPFGLPPLYFYLAWPLSALGPNPVYQALLNAFLSFCSVPLFGYLIYRLLDRVPRQRRLLLSALAALWWSISYVDIQLNNKAWNPSLIPFFLMCLTLLYASETQEALRPFTRAIYWILYGIVAAILISLHGSTLFIIPVIFCISVIYYIAINRARKQRWIFPALALVSMVACLTPYWSEELRAHWGNTHAILATIHSASSTSAGVSTKANNALKAYFSLAQEMYFPVGGGGSILHASSGAALIIRIVAYVFFVATPLLGVAYFRGNKVIFRFMIATWLVYLYAASNFLAIYIHYKMPIVLAPMILCVVSLAYLDYARPWARLAGAFLVVGVLLSMVSNLRVDFGYLAAKFGSHKLVTTSDIASAFAHLPAGARVCSERQGDTADHRLARNKDYLAALGYIDRFETKKGLKFVWPCEPGAYLIHARYVFAYDPYFLPIYQNLRVIKNTPPALGSLVVDQARTYTVELLR